MPDITGNHVKEVRVSEASRADARGRSSRGELVQAVQELEDDRAALGARKRQLEAKLSEIASTVRGRSLPQLQYLALVKEQGELKAEIAVNSTQSANNLVRLNRLKRDLNQYENNKFDEALTLLRKILVELEIMNGRQRAT